MQGCVIVRDAGNRAHRIRQLFMNRSAGLHFSGYSISFNPITG
jgi:hypothetical protein